MRVLHDENITEAVLLFSHSSPICIAELKTPLRATCQLWLQKIYKKPLSAIMNTIITFIFIFLPEYCYLYDLQFCNILYNFLKFPTSRFCHLLFPKLNILYFIMEMLYQSLFQAFRSY